MDGAVFCQKCGADLSDSKTAATSSYSYSGSSTTKRATFHVTSAITDTIALVKSPTAFMTTNRDNDASLQSLIVNYVAVLAAIPFVATLIGDSWYYAVLGLSGVLLGHAFAAALVTYIFDIIGVLVVGFIMWKLAASFGTSTTQIRATRMAAYVFAPFFLLSILDIIPIIGAIAVLGLLYGLYILYLGMPILLNTPKDRVITYLIVTVVVTLVVYAIIGAIIGAVSAAFFVGSVFL